MALIFLQVFAFWIIYRMLRFLSTPILRKAGVYTYYSPFLFSLKKLNNTYELHLGTTWDHFKNPSSTLQIHIYALDGLLKMCEEIRKGSIPSCGTIKGTIHFLNEKSAGKLGFKTKKLNPVDYFLFLLSYPEVVLMKLIISGKFPPVSPFKVKIINCSMEELLAKEDTIRKYKDMFIKRYQNSIKAGYLKVA